MAKKSIDYKGNTFEISYEILNPKSEVDFIVLHGWGSSKSLMKKVFSPYMQDFRHIYIDLPGFGNSTTSTALNSYDYAKIIELFLQELGVSKDIIAGHSFGGKIATLLEPKLLVLLSSAGIYLPKSLHVRTKIALFKILKLFGLSKFRSFFVADDAKQLTPEMYETFKTVVNEDFASVFKNFPNKAVLYWGKEDTATPLEAAKKINTLIQNSSLEIFDGDHYFFMHYPQEIARSIEEKFTALTKRN
ncbi:MAG: alpha/beta hydrolase [Epsilonproteobacteria bacterium]|nr:alpha/beta hydrolase [Campylobacterota bacterium]